MFELMIEEYFSAAHRLRGYQGKCEGLHGHNWQVQVIIKGKELDKLGMLLDFKEMKAYLHHILKKLDHRYLNEISPFDKINPTSENLACFIFKELKKNLSTPRFQLSKVIVWEGDKASASYSEV